MLEFSFIFPFFFFYIILTTISNMSQDNVSSTSTAEAVNNEIKVKEEFPQEEQAHTSLEDKPVSAYIGIIIMCFLIAFGGFVFGFDTGTISGFINMSDF